MIIEGTGDTFVCGKPGGEKALSDDLAEKLLYLEEGNTSLRIDTSLLMVNNGRGMIMGCEV